jgi:putative membrane protein insertion efficiency factor
MCRARHDHRMLRQPGELVSPAARLLIALVTGYRLTLSAVLGRQCRHLPTCSEYALVALRLHGAWAGLFLAVARVSRCGPFGSHGYDPVPETLRADARWWCPWRYGVWRMRRPEDELAPSEPAE